MNSENTMHRLVPTILLLVACERGVVDLPEACDGLQADVDQLEWLDARLGSDEVRTIVLEVPCADLDDVRIYDIRIAGDPVFAVPRIPDGVPAGGSVTVNVRYEPDGYGPHAGSLVVDTSGGELRVPVVGRPNPDQDGDGIDAIDAGGEDCDDQDPTRGAPTDEVTNLVDDDCDGFVDEHVLEAGDVLIAELMLRPQEARVELGQWIEVRNTTDRGIDLLNWTLDGSAGSLRVAGSTVVDAGGVAVLGLSDDPSVNGGIEVDGLLVGSGAPLAQRDWSLTLSADRTIVAELERLAWPDPFGATISLDPIVDDAFRATLLDYWCPSRTELGSGDRGTPGTENDRCDAVDHDGDGRTVTQGDCDDDDPTVAPGKRERWDDRDNDCNGIVDMMWAEDMYEGYLDGDGSTRLGGDGDVGLGDLDGDGRAEIYLGHVYSSRYVVYAAHAEELRGASDPLTSTTYHAWYDSSAALSGAARDLGDVDGDGDDDLLLLSRAQYGSRTLAWLVDELPSVAGTEAGPDEVAAIITSGRDTTYGYQVAGGIIDLDLDGDGADDPVIADTNWVPEGETEVQGRVYVLDLDGVSGEVVAPDHAEAAWDGAPWSALGCRPSGGDLDDDGYDDLFLRDNDPYARLDTQTVHIVRGGSTLPGDGAISGAADTLIVNLVARAPGSLGAVRGTMLLDVDDDGDQDLVVSDPFDERVLIFRDAADLRGTIDAETAFDLDIEGQHQFGHDLSSGDFDGDGVASLVIGAPTTGGSRGLVYILGPDVLAVDRTVESGESEVILWGAWPGGRFGMAVFGADLGGGATDDLVVSEPWYSTSAYGRLWLFEKEAE